MPGVRALFDELHRRRVTRGAAIYIFVAWIVVIAIRAMLPETETGARLSALVVYLAVAGFPFAVAFSWLFRLTHQQGVAIEHDVDDHPPESFFGRALDWLAIAGAGVVLLVSLVRFAMGLSVVP